MDAHLHQRPYRVGIPFAGIDGPGEAARQLPGRRVKVNNVMEKNPHCVKYLNSRLGRDLWCEDVMEKVLEDCEDSDVIFSGPPCKPHSRLGKMGGADDPRSLTFLKAIDIAAELATRKVLKAVIFENSPVVAEYTKNKGRYLDTVNAYWASKMPDWTEFELVRLSPEMFGVPHSRMRLFIISYPVVFTRAIPPPDLQEVEAPEKPADLLDFLEDSTLKFSELDFINAKQNWANVKDWTIEFEDLVWLEPTVTSATTDFCRRVEGAFGAYLTENKVCALTETNYYLGVWGCGPKAAGKVTRAGRWLTNRERGRLAGFSDESIRVLEETMSRRQMQMALGNTIVVPVAKHLLGSIFKYLDACMDKFSKFPFSLWAAEFSLALG